MEQPPRRHHRETGARPKVYNRTASVGDALPRLTTIGLESGIGFSFTHLPYVSCILSGEDQIVQRTSLERGKTLVYLREELELGKKLCVVVQAIEAGANNGLSFGVTTCPPERQRRFENHVQDFCKPGAPCGGNSIWMKVFNINKRGDSVTFEKLGSGAPDLVSITVNHRQPIKMLDPTGIFTSKPLYPFFMLTGSVSQMKLSLPPQPSTTFQPSRVTRPKTPLLHNPAIRPLSPRVPQVFLGNPVPLYRNPLFPPAPQSQIPPYLRRSLPPARPRRNSAPLMTETHIPRDSWLYQQNITLDGSVIGRDGEDVKNYIFNRNAFLRGQVVTFAVREIETFYSGTITFGVTTEDPSTLNLDTLPINSNELSIDRFKKNWYVFSDIVPSAAANQQLSIKRGPTSFTLKTGAKNIQTLFHVEPNKTVYPFFNLNGSIKSIELVGNDVAINNLESSMAQTNIQEHNCVICLEQPANHMLDPCNHVVLCGGCSENLRLTDRTCPVCRASFNKVIKVYLA